MTPIAPIVQAFFTDYLVTQRRLSPNTVRAYRDTWKLLLQYVADQTGTPVHRLTVEQLDHDQIARFLTHLEATRGNTVSTRNARLAAIHAWCAYAARTLPTHVADLARINAIPVKKHTRPDLTWLTGNETQALLDTIPTTTWTGRRDHALLALAAHTGLRVGEIADLTITDLQLATPAHVACHGKGRKRRTTPITQTLADSLAAYLNERETRPGQALFPGPHGQAMSTDAIRYRLAVHLAAASTTCPSLTGKHVTMHTLRHSAAMRFLHAGVDTSVIALWLGHEQIATTGVYLHADLTIKQQALDRTRPPDTPPGTYQPDDALLAWLSDL